MKIGDRVRSYDFRGVDDCYVEGVLVGYEAVDCPRYRISVTKVVWKGREENDASLVGAIVRPPVNGTANFAGEECDFVRVIE